MSVSTDCTTAYQPGSHPLSPLAEVPPLGDRQMIFLPIPAVCGEIRNVCVRLADSVAQRNSACILINKMYAWRGYGDDHRIPARATHSTFTASDQDELIGTLTLAVDSPAGLAADTIFREEIDMFRQQPGAKVCELTKLAFNSTVPSKPMLAALFHIVFIHGQRQHHCTDLFIEVNPRHRRFYQAMLGFKPIGETKINASVGAPSQLMVLKIAEIRGQIDRYAGQGDAATARSLYPFFFSPREEDGIYRRLTGQGVEQADDTDMLTSLAYRMPRAGTQSASF
jgi:hypothetical protein